MDIANIGKLPIIIEKYLTLQYDLMQKINIMEIKKSEIRGKRLRYYKEEYEHILSNTEVKQYVETDNDFLTYLKKTKDFELYLKMITEMIAELRSHQWILKTQLEYQKFIYDR